MLLLFEPLWRYIMSVCERVSDCGKIRFVPVKFTHNVFTRLVECPSACSKFSFLGKHTRAYTKICAPGNIERKPSFRLVRRTRIANCNLCSPAVQYKRHFRRKKNVSKPLSLYQVPTIFSKFSAKF